MERKKDKIRKQIFTQKCDESAIPNVEFVGENGCWCAFRIIHVICQPTTKALHNHQKHDEDAEELMSWGKMVWRGTPQRILDHDKSYNCKSSNEYLKQIAK